MENKKQEMLELSTSIRQDVFKNLGIARLIRFSHPQFADELDEYKLTIIFLIKGNLSPLVIKVLAVIVTSVV